MALFRFDSNLKATQVRQIQIPREKDIQRACEKNLETLLGVRFLASEFNTGEKHAGRIDTLGLDQNGCPVILEYKKHESENIITQGLYYLDWLMDHRGDFEVLVRRTLGEAARVDWSAPRLVLIAESFNKFDNHAVGKISHRIELRIYRWHEGGLLQLEDFHGTESAVAQLPMRNHRPRRTQGETFDLNYHLQGKPQAIQHLMNELREQILSLSGTDAIREVAVKNYVAYKTTKNFCEVEIQKSKLKVYIDIDKENLEDPKGWAQDCTKVGHWATGNCRFVLAAGASIEYAMGLVRQSHRANS